MGWLVSEGSCSGCFHFMEARYQSLVKEILVSPEYRERWTYMMENPIRNGLVNQWEEWPWQGRVHNLMW